MWRSSVRSRFAKRVGSSAYWEHLSVAAQGRIGCSSPLLAANSISWCSGSIPWMKSMGESGSPCRSPLPCFIYRPRIPFRRILKMMRLARSQSNPSIAARTLKLAFFPEEKPNLLNQKPWRCRALWKGLGALLYGGPLSHSGHEWNCRGYIAFWRKHSGMRTRAHLAFELIYQQDFFWLFLPDCR